MELHRRTLHEVGRRGQHAGRLPGFYAGTLENHEADRHRRGDGAGHLRRAVASAMAIGFMVFQSPRVKSGKPTGMLPAATDLVESSTMQLHAAASYTTLSGVTPRRTQSRRRQFIT